MPRIYDSSFLTQRKAELAAASSFFTPANGSTVPWGSRPLLGIKDSSIIYTVKNGAMTEYTRYDGCIGISAGCPCPALATSIAANAPALPGFVSGITFTVGSVIVSWQAPTVGAGPFSYVVTPYLNGVALSPVTTSALTYRFTGLDEFKQYTFTVCAVNAAGTGPAMNSSEFMAPPEILSTILAGTAPLVDVSSCLTYLINAGLDSVLQHFVSMKYGPTIASRLVYLWTASVVQAWNWVTPDTHVSGILDNWDWTANVVTPLNDCESIVWIAAVMDQVTPLFIPGYTSLFIYDATTLARVKDLGGYAAWLAAWNTWYAGRLNDGSVAASTAQPTTSANWGQTIVVDGTTVNNIGGFPNPLAWTRLTVGGKKQNYLTYSWDTVRSTCLTEEDEVNIEGSVAPLTGAARNAEVDAVLQMSGSLTDAQKVQAEFWAGSTGNISPPLMGIWLWKEYIRSIGVTCPFIMYSLLDMAVHMFEGARVTWRIKSAHMEARPIQEIRRRYVGQTVQSWNGVVQGEQWIPYQETNFVTPPFGDFNSGHSHFTKLFALTMSKWFGSSIVKNTITYDGLPLMAKLFKGNQTGLYGDFVVGVGSSTIQASVPAAPVTFSFSTWDEIADSAGYSRLYGGIHCLSANTTSQTTAVLVDSLINSTWNINSIINSAPSSATEPVITGMIMAMAEANPDAGAQTIMDWIAGHPEESVPVPVPEPSVPEPSV
jgi:hypothetical protein